MASKSSLPSGKKAAKSAGIKKASKQPKAPLPVTEAPQRITSAKSAAAPTKPRKQASAAKSDPAEVAAPTLAEAPSKKVSAKKAPVAKASVKQVSAKKAAAKQAPVKASAKKNAPKPVVKDDPTKTAGARPKQAAAKKAPAKPVAAKPTPAAKKAPKSAAAKPAPAAKKAPPKQAAAKPAPAPKQVPAKQAAAKPAPAAKKAPKQAAAKPAPAPKQVAAKQAAVAKAPVKKAPVKKTPVKKAMPKKPKPAPASPLNGAPATPSNPTPLGAGDAAPAFELMNQEGKLVSSNDLMGKPYVLYFYPKDNTPGCTTEACAFRDLHPDFGQLGVSVFGISADSSKSHAGFAGKYELPFTLLADTDKNLINAYGAWVSKKNYGKEYMGIERSTFLIDGSGTVKHAWRSVKVNGHAQAVLEEARKLG